MNPLEKYIRWALMQGYPEEEVYGFLKQQGHSDEEIRSSWTLPSQISVGEGLKAAGTGAMHTVDQLASDIAGYATGNKNPLDLITGIPSSLAGIGKGIYGIGKAALSPNMPADERLAHIQQAGGTVTGLGVMDVAGRALNEAFPRAGSTAGLSVLSPKRMAAEAAKIPERASRTFPNPTTDLGKFDLIDQVIDPNIGKLGPSITPPKGIGNASGPQVTGPTVIPPDPNIPMGEMVPKSFMGLSKPGNQGPGATVPPSPLPGVIKGTEGEMQYLNRQPTLNPLDELAAEMPPQQLTPKGPSARLQGIREARNAQIMSDPAFRAKFMQNPERGAFNPWSLYALEKTLYYTPKVLKILGNAAKSTVNDFTYPSLLGVPFAPNTKDSLP